MSETTAPAPSDGDEPTEDGLDQDIFAEHDSVPPDVREQVLERDGYRCRIDGRRQIDPKSSPQLVVQRLQEHPRDCHSDALENLTTCCLRCARWIRQMPTRDDLPSPLRDRLNGVDLDADHIKMLRHFHDHGPARTGELIDIVDRANKTSVRRALYDLMGLDVSEECVSDRIVAKDRFANLYGLPWQIPEHRQARGIIPLQPHQRRTRILEAFTARLIAELEGKVANPREITAGVIDREANQTYNLEKRAQAFQFPFDEWAAIDRSNHDEAAAVEAVTILAGVTDNVSRQHIAAPLVEIFERNDEHELATIIREVLLDNERSFEVFARQNRETASGDDIEGQSDGSGTEAVDDCGSPDVADSDPTVSNLRKFGEANSTRTLDSAVINPSTETRHQ